MMPRNQPLVVLGTGDRRWVVLSLLAQLDAAVPLDQVADVTMGIMGTAVNSSDCAVAHSSHLLLVQPYSGAVLNQVADMLVGIMGWPSMVKTMHLRTPVTCISCNPTLMCLIGRRTWASASWARRAGRP